ncbi:MAG TPA: class I SAM-dependent methyltransferase [Vicinamibacterales bacterium]
MTRGVRQIVRFNWPFYGIAAAALALAPPVIMRLPLPAAARALVYAATGLAGLWIATSLVASWIVYDRSPLMRWDWLPRALGFQPGAWINIHAGLDESTPAVRAIFGARGRVFDIFDPAEMTEPSIAVARRTARNAVTPETVDFRHLPVATGTIEAALLLLSAHELRTDAARTALFTELRRVLGPGGRVVVAEHLRDAANFLAFGPGFLHFHSRRTWARCFSRTRFDIHAEFPITPFVRVFVLRRLT